jgi:hypothetical protein
MADISSLGNLLPVEPIDLDVYPEARGGFELPKAGEYTVQAPDSFPETAFGKTREGNLNITIDPTIVGPTNGGFQLRYATVSAKQTKRDGITVSQLGDYLRACGLRQRLTSVQEQADAVEQTVNRQFKVYVNWKAYNKVTGFEVKGMDKFPVITGNGHQPWIEDPNDFERDDTGTILMNEDGTKRNKRLRANVYIQRFLSAV